MAKGKRNGAEVTVTIDQEKLTVDKRKVVTIKSATLAGGFCNYSFDQEVAKDTTNTVNIKSGLLVHDDLRNAFKKLYPHLAVICEEVDKHKIDDIDTVEEFDHTAHKEGSIEHKLSHFTVSAFKISGTGENEGVSLTGEKRLSTGEHVGLVTPKITWDDSSYLFVNELRIAVGEVISEVELYMEGKCAPQLVQQEMEFEDSLAEESR